MARIGSALLALMFGFMTCGTSFAASNKGGGGKGHGSSKGSGGSKSSGGHKGSTGKSGSTGSGKGGKAVDAKD